MEQMTSRSISGFVSDEVIRLGGADHEAISSKTLNLVKITAIALAAVSFASPVAKRGFGPVVIFDPPSDYIDQKTLYGRSLIINNSTILTTFESYTPVEPLYFPICKSTDHGGHTWSEFFRVYDQVNGWGLRYQPFLYQLDEPFGGYDAGTILLAGNSIPKDLSVTQLDLYASTDEGCTWVFVSHIATGGKALPIDGLTPVWEPFLMIYKDQLVCYYSDQRDPLYGQKLVHQVTNDNQTWGPVVNDVTYDNSTYRPGMTIVSKLPTDEYIMTYEFYGAVEIAFAAYYKISANPLKFYSIVGAPIIAEDGFVPSSTPYNTITPDGILIANAASSTDLFLNYDCGTRPWKRVKTTAPASYTRSLRITPWDTTSVLIVGGGPITGNGSTNEVTADVKRVEKKKK